jgi:hypothetical protein
VLLCKPALLRALKAQISANLDCSHVQHNS